MPTEAPALHPGLMGGHGLAARVANGRLRRLQALLGALQGALRRRLRLPRHGFLFAAPLEGSQRAKPERGHVHRPYSAAIVSAKAALVSAG